MYIRAIYSCNILHLILKKQNKIYLRTIFTAKDKNKKQNNNNKLFNYILFPTLSLFNIKSCNLLTLYLKIVAHFRRKKLLLLYSISFLHDMAVVLEKRKHHKWLSPILPHTPPLPPPPHQNHPWSPFCLHDLFHSCSEAVNVKRFSKQVR